MGPRGEGQDQRERYRHQHGDAPHGNPPGVDELLGGSGGPSKTTDYRRIAQGCDKNQDRTGAGGADGARLG